ncbi:MAG: asparagine synthase (glutamine-hydrolyzing) [Thermoanaerobaculia bacterium]
MCGIYGLIRLGREGEAAFESMGEALHHRGPDAGRLERISGGVVLGHRRLRIIDLSEAASQPLWDVGRRACVTYNGEIYNFRELREECEREGMEFRSASDTEVIVNHYLLRGESSFDRLNGIFSFCLYDARSETTWLVRDPMGVKPLYFSRTPSGVLFGSELGCLLRSGLIDAEVDPESLTRYLMLDYVPSPGSILRGVEKLSGGEMLKIRRGRVELLRYSALSEIEEEVRRPVRQDLELFTRTMTSAVERQLVADVPVGCFLSGGIDSSIVAHLAARLTGGSISTFSLAFAEPSFDESRYFTTVARALGLRQKVEVLSPDTMVGLLPGLPAILSEPIADGSIVPTLLLSRFARREVTVALSGDGADELFAGYPTYLAHKAAEAVPASLRRTIGWGGGWLAHRLLRASHEDLSVEFKVKKFFDGLDPDPIVRNFAWLGTFNAREAAVLTGHVPSPTLWDLLKEPSRRLPERDRLEQLLRTDQRFYLQDQVLAKVDRASMAESLEVRVPFLDHEVVAFAHRLPVSRKLRGGTTKWLLRQYVRANLPAVIATRPKKGFGVPLARWFSAELKDLVSDTLEPGRLRASGIVDPAPVQRLLNEHWSGRRDHRKKLFNLLMLVLWREWLTTARVCGAAATGQKDDNG